MLYQETWQKDRDDCKLKREIDTERGEKDMCRRKILDSKLQMYIKSISDNLHSLDIKGQLQNVQEKEKKNIYIS